ncbi:MAG: ABC transporter ATP-binding protein [Opitutales bacterium]
MSTVQQANAPVLRAKGLIKAYEGRKVLDGVSLTIAPGERVALMGPSGSGKSTLLNCAGGIDRPDEGTIEIDGQTITDLGGESLAHIRRHLVGTVFQFFHLLPTLSARENVELPLQLQNVPHRERQERVASLLKETGIAHRADALPETLSGGEMQRVAIARALVHRPRLILADEPTGNLDSRTGERVLDLLESLTQAHETALLMVTHSEATTRICRRVVHLLDGRIQSEDTAAMADEPAVARS